MTAATAESLRLDKWLFHARFFKSRSLATRLCEGRKVRLNRRLIDKASCAVRVGDVLTFPQGRHICVVRILGLGQRRGPAAQAQSLYEDLAPPGKAAPKASPAAARDKGTGRPTKAQRRATERLWERR